MCGTSRVLALLAIYVRLAHSWDFALSVGDELRFYTNNTRISTIRFESRNLTAIAYDEVRNMILYVDKQTNGDAICGYTLSSVENKCFTERTGRNIHGIAFDPVTDMVFFTDTSERTINWISLKPGSENNASGNLLITMDEEIPRDIVVDSCKRYVYWLNTGLTKPTIERAQFNGTEREVFENITSLSFNATHKLEPHSLAIDQQTQSIHWIEPTNSTMYELIVSTLDRKHKEGVIYKYFTDYPMYNHPLNTLTISKKAAFSVSFQTEPRRVYKYPNEFEKVMEMFVVHDKMTSVGIVANYKIADQIQGRKDCEGLKSLIEIPAETDETFCVHGVKVNGQSVCECSPGYTGERCDISICDNYCLQGNCSVSNESLPECRCDAGYSGIRCEINACHGYCLNDGECLLNEEEDPFCQCVDRYEGSRCESDKTANLSNTLLPTYYLKERNLTVADLLSNLREPSSKKFIIVEV